MKPRIMHFFDHFTNIQKHSGMITIWVSEKNEAHAGIEPENSTFLSHCATFVYILKSCKSRKLCWIIIIIICIPFLDVIERAWTGRLAENQGP